MPLLEPVSISSEQYELRLCGPRAAVWPASPAENATVLARTDMVARPLPSDPSPESRDFASGSWTGRLDDAGEFTITFPNAESSDGAPWRSRFDPGVAGQRLQWIEIYQNGYLEFVGVIMTVVPDRDQVQITGYDGSYLLKNAYERDWTVVQAPRDVFERGTQVWVPITVDGFPAGSLSSQWTVSSGNATIGPSGGVVLGNRSGATGTITTGAVTVPATSTWTSTTTTLCPAPGSALFHGAEPSLVVTESSGDVYTLSVSAPEYGAAAGSAQLWWSGDVLLPIGTLSLPSSDSYNLLLESDGEWVWAFVNGQLASAMRRANATTTSLTTALTASGLTAQRMVPGFTAVYTKALQPFLM